jgi:dTMP kinase
MVTTETEKEHIMIVGKLIVIEGGDGAGKGTQSELARAALAELGEITYFDFPRYGKSIAGKIVGAALKGDYGDFLHMHPLISSLPYALDRVGAREEILAALEKGNVTGTHQVTSCIRARSSLMKKNKSKSSILSSHLNMVS